MLGQGESSGRDPTPPEQILEAMDSFLSDSGDDDEAVPSLTHDGSEESAIHPPLLEIYGGETGGLVSFPPVPQTAPEDGGASLGPGDSRRKFVSSNKENSPSDGGVSGEGDLSQE